jgi:hypothetical protein
VYCVRLVPGKINGQIKSNGQRDRLLSSEPCDEDRTAGDRQPKGCGGPPGAAEPTRDDLNLIRRVAHRHGCMPHIAKWETVSGQFGGYPTR